ncbi:MAG: endonuclease III domain-containing protein [Candidatus Brocadiia bacterium]
MDLSSRLMALYDALREAFGHREWWPGDTPFEVMAGAILTQRTNWQNVEKAIDRLKEEDALDPQTLADIEPEVLHELVRPAGYYRQKSARLIRLARWVMERTGGELERLEAVPTDELRAELLGLRGVGPETADSILLYALDRLTFVVDTYTNRVLVRHGLLDPGAGYHEMKDVFESALPADLELYRDFHAQLVELGKQYCRTTPRCSNCPARPVLGQPIPDDELV